MRLRRSPSPVLVFLLVASPRSAAQELELNLVEVASGLTRPIAVAHAGDGSGRLFIAQQTGEIVILDQGTVLATPFLDISSLVTCCGERGLLGLAFHPQYASNGLFYVHYSDDSGGDTVVARYQVSEGNPDLGDSGSALIVLTEDQPDQHTNHNGGQIAFGPDGYLYLALGDGGGGGDPGENAQDLSTLLGKILRIDVDSDDFADPNRNYAIPGDNPFLGNADALDEIWASGLRNPWRFSFDRLTGDLWIGDVGQNTWEEIDFQPATSDGGENYGWDVLEGGLQPGTPGPGHPNCFEDVPDGSCADFLTGSSTLPVLEYDHDLGCSVTGGYRYRGLAEPRLFGIYFYADFCSGRVWGALPDCSGGFVSRVLHDAPFNITAFGEDEAGELYVTEYSQTAGQSALHRIIADSAPGGPELTPDRSQIDFASLGVGGSADADLILQNTGTGQENLVIEALVLTDDVNFGLELNAGSSPCGIPPLCLPAGTSCTLAVTFQPNSEGDFDELLMFAANSTPTSVGLQGTAPCAGEMHLVLADANITSDVVHVGCQTIIAGPNLTITSTGHLELRAGDSVSIVPPFKVEAGGGLELVLDPALAE